MKNIASEAQQEISRFFENLFVRKMHEKIDETPGKVGKSLAAELGGVKGHVREVFDAVNVLSSASETSNTQLIGQIEDISDNNADGFRSLKSSIDSLPEKVRASLVGDLETGVVDKICQQVGALVAPLVVAGADANRSLQSLGEQLVEVEAKVSEAGTVALNATLLANQNLDRLGALAQSVDALGGVVKQDSRALRETLEGELRQGMTVLKSEISAVEENVAGLGTAVSNLSVLVGRAERSMRIKTGIILGVQVIIVALGVYAALR